MSAAPSPSGVSVAAWMTRAIAVFVLVFGVFQITRTFVDVRDRRRQINELTGSAIMEKRAGDYPRAWIDLDQAVAVVEARDWFARLTGQLGSEAHDLRIAQENLAMAWLDNLPLAPSRAISEIIDHVSPVLTRGTTDAAGPRKADLVAHLGWISVLESREGPGADPEQQFRDALALDGANPYGHAYLGHWLLSKNAPIDQGESEFQQALASGRARDYVRTLELAALKNRGADARFVAVVTDMQEHGEAVDLRTRAELYDIYTRACGVRDDAAAMQLLAGAAPAADQAAAVQALLVDAPDVDPGRRSMSEACVATLLEAAGKRDGAVDTWRTVRKNAPPGDPNGLGRRADAALRRLAR